MIDGTRNNEVCVLISRGEFQPLLISRSDRSGVEREVDQLFPRWPGFSSQREFGSNKVNRPEIPGESLELCAITAFPN